jgi:hypothetical protein
MIVFSAQLVEGGGSAVPSTNSPEQLARYSYLYSSKLPLFPSLLDFTFTELQKSESIKLFIELQAFSLSRDLAPPPPPPPFTSRQQVVSLSQSSCVSPVGITVGIGREGVGEESIYMTARKTGPL